MALRGVVGIASARVARRRYPSLLSLTPLRLYDSASYPHNKGLIPYANSFQNGFKNPIRAIHEAAVDPITPKKDNEEHSTPNWKIKMLYDGDCPLCMREVNMLRERDKHYGAIKFVDISADDYSPEENQGLDYKTVMGRIHAINSDGTVVTDVEAFRRLYEEVGLGWVYAITKYKFIGAIADAVYGVWAKYRLQITGRQPLEELLEARKKNRGEVCKDSNACKT